MKCLKVGFIIDPHLNERPPRSRKDDFLGTILGKIDHVAMENDVVILLGDIFEKPAVPDFVKAALFKRLMDYREAGTKVYAIPGNHDLYNYNIDTFKKTSLGLIALTGALEIVETIKVNCLTITAIPFMRKAINLQVPIAETENSVLIGHYYYNSPHDPARSITPAQVERWGYDYLLLGHDHEEHEPLVIGKTTLFRQGAISRGTKHKHNLSRTPKYLQMVVSDRIESVQTLEVPHMDVSECFHSLPKDFDDKKATKNIMENLDSLFEAFRSSKSSGTTLAKILDKLDTPTHIVDYLRNTHRKLNIDF